MWRRTLPVFLDRRRVSWAVLLPPIAAVDRSGQVMVCCMLIFHDLHVDFNVSQGKVRSRGEKFELVCSMVLLPMVFLCAGMYTPSKSGAPFREVTGHIARVRVDAWFVRIDEPVQAILDSEEFKTIRTPSLSSSEPMSATKTGGSESNPQDVFFHVTECKFEAETISNLVSCSNA